MKKFALPMGVLAILIAGVLLLMNQKEEVVPTADNEKVVSDVQTEGDNVSEVSKETEKTNEKKIDSNETNKIIVETVSNDAKTEEPKIELNGYTLPPVPDKKLNDSTLLGIDNNFDGPNGIRDDLEIEILQSYSSDPKVVEGFFAYVRSDALDFKIMQEDIFTDEIYEDISRRSTLATGCRGKVLDESNFTEPNTLDSYNIALDFENKTNNTFIRENNTKQFFSRLNGQVFLARPVSDEECEAFFEETKNYDLY